MTAPSWHAWKVLEYERVREIITEYTTSPLGRAAARELRPERDLETVRRLLEETEEARALLRSERLPLSAARDVVRELAEETSMGRPAEPALLWRIVELLRGARWAREQLARHGSALPRLAAIAEGLRDAAPLREAIEAKVDARDGLVDSASARLAELRRTARELRDSLRERAQRILTMGRLRAAFQAEAVTIKADRFLLPVRAEYRSWIAGPVRDRSQSGATLYIEPEELTLDGDRLLEAIDAERDESLRILWELTRLALEERPALTSTQEAFARLDLAAAKAAYAETFELTSPEVNAEGILDLPEARHPYLLWLARAPGSDPRAIDVPRARERVVPIRIRLGSDFRVLVITGPNTGGKTVALKTVGLCVLLALSGVPIPAGPGARVPCYANIFADIGDEQSLEQSLSTFSSHLKNIVEVLRDADERCLILLDELGSGTDPLEGAALGRAILQAFLERGWSAIITTHIGSLKEFAFGREGVENAAMEFDPRTLRPTYRLLLGIAGSSNALSIAESLGVDPALVARAREEVEASSQPSRELLGRMEKTRRRIEKELRRAERLRRRAQEEARVQTGRLAELEARAEAWRAEAQLLVDESLRSAREELRPLLDGLKSVPKTHKEFVDKLQEAVEHLLLAGPLGERREAFARSLKKEDDVYVPKFRARGRVRKIDKGNRKLIVQLEGSSLEIGFDDVSWLDAPPGLPAG